MSKTASCVFRTCVQRGTIVDLDPGNFAVSLVKRVGVGVPDWNSWPYWYDNSNGVVQRLRNFLDSSLIRQ